MDEDRIVALVDRAKEKDNDAIAALIKSSQDKLFFVAKSYVKNDADAADVLQNAYIKAFSSLNTLYDSTKFEGWLTRIVTNAALDHMKRNSTKYDVKFTDLGDDENGLSFDPADEKIDSQPELSFSQNETQKILREIIDTLSDEQRVAVMMYFYDGMTTREIAEEIGCKEVTVKARIRYAKERIKESVVRIEKRGDFKLHSLAPLTFFLYLLRQQAGSAYGYQAAAKAAGVSTASSAAKATAAHAGMKAGSGIAVKIGVAAAVAVAGGTAAYHFIGQNQKQTIETGVYESENEEQNIELKKDMSFTWQLSVKGNLQKMNGTYSVQKDQLVIQVTEGDQASKGCAFKIENDKLVVNSGTSEGCTAGVIYQYASDAPAISSAASAPSPSATAAPLTNQEIKDKLIAAGFTIKHGEYPGDDNMMCTIQNVNDEYEFFVTSNSEEDNRARGFAYQFYSKETGGGNLEKSDSGECAFYDWAKAVSIPDFQMTEKPRKSVLIRLQGGTVEKLSEDSVYIEKAKKLYQHMQETFARIGITEDEFYRFACTYSDQ